MTRAKNSRGELAIIKEVEFGKKVTTGAATKLRITGESLKQNNQYADSNEIRADRQQEAAELTEISTSGSINVELSYGTFDELYEAGFFSAGWSSQVTVTASTISIAAADNSINDSASGFGDMSANQWIKLSGTENNDGIYKVVSATAGKLIVSYGALVDESAGSAVTVVQGSQIVNGVTKSSFNAQRQYTDLVSKFATFLGQVIKGFNLNFALNSRITGSFDLIGKCEESDDTQIGNSYATVDRTPSMKTTKSIKGIFENGTKVSATDFTIALDNSCQVADELNDESGPIDIDEGTVIVTASLKAYFKDHTLYDKYLNDVESSVAIIPIDKLGNAYVIELPAIKFSDGNRTIQNKDGSVMADMQIKAHVSNTEGITARMVRFPTS